MDAIRNGSMESMPFPGRDSTCSHNALTVVYIVVISTQVCLGQVGLEPFVSDEMTARNVTLRVLGEGLRSISGEKPRAQNPQWISCLCTDLLYL